MQFFSFEKSSKTLAYYFFLKTHSNYFKIFINISNIFPGIGTCSLLARIGALLAPQMAYLSEIYPPIPYIIVCSIGIISLLISCFFLPDTKGVDLGALDRNPLEESGDNKEEEISEIQIGTN